MTSILGVVELLELPTKGEEVTKVAEAMPKAAPVRCWGSNLFVLMLVCDTELKVTKVALLPVMVLLAGSVSFCRPAEVPELKGKIGNVEKIRCHVWRGRGFRLRTTLYLRKLRESKAT